MHECSEDSAKSENVFADIGGVVCGRLFTVVVLGSCGEDKVEYGLRCNVERKGQSCDILMSCLEVCCVCWYGEVEREVCEGVCE